MNIPDISTIDIALFVKLFLLIIIGFYAIFVLVIFNNIRGLGKLIIIENAGGSPFIKLLSYVYLGLTVLLFIATLVLL